MPQTNNSRGFFTLAQNTPGIDYVKCAYALALSLKQSQKNISNLSIAVTPGVIVPEQYAWAFDQIIEIPWGDQAENSTWKLENEWKVPYITPYDETIKLDADMLFFTDITDWWNFLEKSTSDIICANSVLNWRGEKITSDFCRKTFTANKLPNIYSGFTYLKKTEPVFEIYELMKLITWNWEKFWEEFLEANTRPTVFSTDVALALALKILDLDKHHYKERAYPTFTHMKTELQGIGEHATGDWTACFKSFFSLESGLKIGNHRQKFPLHYVVKHFITQDIIEKYESQVKI
jgi:hypothetical protein